MVRFAIFYFTKYLIRQNYSLEKNYFTKFMYIFNINVYYKMNYTNKFYLLYVSFVSLKKKN